MAHYAKYTEQYMPRAIFGIFEYSGLYCSIAVVLSSLFVFIKLLTLLNRVTSCHEGRWRVRGRGVRRWGVRGIMRVIEKIRGWCMRAGGWRVLGIEEARRWEIESADSNMQQGKTCGGDRWKSTAKGALLHEAGGRVNQMVKQRGDEGRVGTVGTYTLNCRL